jgi:hypothetical protein
LPGFTSRCTRPGHLLDDRHRARGNERPLSREHATQVWPVDIAHRDEELILCLAGLEDRDDVRVVDRRGEARFTREARAELHVVGVARRKQLQRDVAPESLVSREQHDAHAALAELTHDGVVGHAPPDMGRHGHR